MFFLKMLFNALPSTRSVIFEQFKIATSWWCSHNIYSCVHLSSSSLKCFIKKCHWIEQHPEFNELRMKGGLNCTRLSSAVQSSHLSVDLIHTLSIYLQIHFTRYKYYTNARAAKQMWNDHHNDYTPSNSNITKIKNEANRLCEEPEKTHVN